MSGSEEGKAHELVIIRRRGHDEEGGHHGGVWKIAYADFMTAMMAFFLVVWLINSTDKKTLTQVATYFNPMRLTDKKPSTKGLEEPSGGGGEGKGTPAQKDPAKKDDAKAKSKKKAEELPPGDVRPRGKLFQRGAEDQEQKQSAVSGAGSSEVQQQDSGRAYRDPFDAVRRSEVRPSEPTNGRPSRNPPAAAPQTAGRDAPAGKAAATQPLVAAPPVGGPTRDARADVKSGAPNETGDRAEAAKQEAAGNLRETFEAAKLEAAGRLKGASADAAELEAAGKLQEAGIDAATLELAIRFKEASDRAEAAKLEAVAKVKEASDRADAQQLEVEIKRAVAEAVPGSLPNIEVVVTAEGVLISLTDDYEFGMFAIASAEPRPAMVTVMDKLAKIIQSRPEPLIIRGHTDRRPYRTATYDNWRLSAARAHMAYVLLVRSGVDEKRFERIEGRADRNLRVQHDPEAAQNRRIEILLRK
jgi:chemotaxis protein MotB